MNIKVLREEKGMSQLQLAEALGVTRSTVAMWEIGQSKPRFDVLVDIAKLFDCTVDELIKKEK